MPLWDESQPFPPNNHPDAQKLIRSFKPSSLRWPHGVWANVYDWEVDGRRMYDDYKTQYRDAVEKHPALNGIKLSGLLDKWPRPVSMGWHTHLRPWFGE